MTVFNGGAFLALWNDIEPARDDEYNDWHAREHVPERLTVPGMLRGRRYVARDDAIHPYFTLYEMIDEQVLASDRYKALLSSPTPWSLSMRPSFRNFCRMPCQLIASSGFALGAVLMTIEVTQIPASAHVDWVSCLDRILALPGISAVHAGQHNRALSALPWRDQPDPRDSLAAQDSHDVVLLVEAQEAAHLQAQHRPILQLLDAQLPSFCTINARHYHLMTMSVAT